MKFLIEWFKGLMDMVRGLDRDLIQASHQVLDILLDATGMSEHNFDINQFSEFLGFVEDGNPGKKWTVRDRDIFGRMANLEVMVLTTFMEAIVIVEYRELGEERTLVKTGVVIRISNKRIQDVQIECTNVRQGKDARNEAVALFLSHLKSQLAHCKKENGDPRTSEFYAETVATGG